MNKSIRKTKGQSLKVDWSVVVAIGIDLGDRISQYVALNANGEVVGQGRVPTTDEALTQKFGTIGSKVIAIETGTHSPWVSRLLERLTHRVTVANSRKLRLIYENRNKNDKVDADYLARLVRVDPKLLSPVEHRGERPQQHIAVLRARDQMVKMRSGLITHVRGAVKSIGSRMPSCSAEAFVKRGRPELPSTLRQALEPVLMMIEQFCAQIAAYDRQIEKLAKDEYRDAQVLMQIPGVGALSAVAFIVTIGARDRFQHSRTAEHG